LDGSDNGASGGVKGIAQTNPPALREATDLTLPLLLVVLAGFAGLSAWGIRRSRA
jgi:hypothetical protein